GKIRKGQKIALIKDKGERVDDTITQLYVFDRLGRIETDEVGAGDICAVVGLEKVDIGDTIADFENPVALPPIRVDEPTLDMLFRINDSPFVGQEGTYVTSRQLRDRLMKELQSNVALRVRPSEERKDEVFVSGRGLIGLRTRLMNATSGQAIMHHNFYEYQPLRGNIPGRANGVMVSTESGRTTAYALENLQERGSLFVGAGEQVYEGQVVGEHCRDNDLPVNVCREKKLTNVRSSTAEKTILLKPPRQMNLELALEYIEDDELVEVTP